MVHVALAPTGKSIGATYSPSETRALELVYLISPSDLQSSRCLVWINRGLSPYIRLLLVLHLRLA